MAPSPVQPDRNAPAEVDPEADSPARAKAWDDVPLRVKISLLVTVAAVVGCVVGIVEAQMGYQVWPMALGLGAALAVIAPLAHAWAVGPIDRLVERLSGPEVNGRPVRMRGLPTQREDEVGLIARGLDKMSIQAVRDYHKARVMQRTLDDRITRATAEATRRLKQIALRDPLTDLGNRRFMDEHLESLVRSCQASKTELVCVVLDLDNFKRVNDALGHAVGDKLLVVLSGLIRGSIRHDDFAIRLGGDEFVLFMPGCTPERAERTMTHVSNLFRQHVCATLPPDARADVSVGIASLSDEDVDCGPDLLAKADNRLYAAKADGKARIVAA